MKTTSLRSSPKKTALRPAKRPSTAKRRPKMTLTELRDLRKHFDLAGWNASGKRQTATSGKAAGK